MALIRWEPVRELSTMQSEMNRLFGTFFDSPTPGNGRRTALRGWTPAMDVTENENEYVLKADLPGLSEGDVNVELDHNVLTISGERKSEHEQRSPKHPNEPSGCDVVVSSDRMDERRNEINRTATVRAVKQLVHGDAVPHQGRPY